MTHVHCQRATAVDASPQFFRIRNFFPESVWAQGSSNSGVCQASSHLHIFSSSHLLIFTSSHLLIFTSSHLDIFSSSYPLILTSSHPHISSSSHPHIFTSSHLLIFTSSHLHILSSSHPHILTSSHLLIFTSSDLHIFSSSHLLIFTSSHLHIFPSSHLLIFTSSHLHIFLSSHPHIFTSSHLHIFSSSHPHIFSSSHSVLLCCSLALLQSPSFLFLSWRRGAVPTRRHETQPFRTKWALIAKNCGKIAISRFPSQPFRAKWGSIAKNCSKIAISGVQLQPFRTKWGSIAKNCSKIAISGVQSQPFRTKWSSIAKNCNKIAISLVQSEPFRTTCCHAGCHVVLRGRRGTLWHSNLFYTVSNVTKLEDVSHEMLVMLRLGVLSGVSGFPVASPCLWGKLQNLFFSKVATKVVMLFCVAGVALCDIPTSLGCLARNARFASPMCLVSSLWFSCGLAVPMGEAANPLLSKVATKVVMLFCVAGVALWDIPACFIPCRKWQNWRKSRTKCSFWCPSTLHTLHFTLYTLHCTLHTLQTPHSSLHTLHFNYTPHFTLRTRHSTLYTLTHSPTHSLTDKLPLTPGTHIVNTLPKWHTCTCTCIHTHKLTHHHPSITLILSLPLLLFCAQSKSGEVVHMWGYPVL